MRALILMLLIGPSLSTAQLKSLKPFPPTPMFSFDPSAEPTLPKCDEVISRINRLQQISDESHLSLIDFMRGSAKIIGEWHTDLKPLEGKTAAIAPDQFQPLKSGAEQILELTDLGYMNADYISLEIWKISQALTKCLPQQGVSSGLSEHN